MARKFAELKEKMSDESRARAHALSQEIAAEMAANPDFLSEVHAARKRVEVGQNVEEMREELHLSREDLAGILGITIEGVEDIELGYFEGSSPEILNEVEQAIVQWKRGKVTSDVFAKLFKKSRSSWDADGLFSRTSAMAFTATSKTDEEA